LGAQLGVKVNEEVVDSLPTILTGLSGGRYQAFNAPLADTAVREKSYDMIAWTKTHTAYLLPAGSPLAKANQAPCGVKVAIVSGSIPEETFVASLNKWCVGQGQKADQVLALADTTSTILAIGSGRADTAALQETSALDAIQASPGKYTYVNQTAAQGVGVTQLSMVTAAGNDLGEVFFKAWQQIFSNGEYANLMKKYGLTTLELTAPEINPATGRKP
jgi:polar amino acid transport system substrate-binding protein